MKDTNYHQHIIIMNHSIIGSSMKFDSLIFFKIPFNSRSMILSAKQLFLKLLSKDAVEKLELYG